ncbi:MAG: GntR family transcriptional regulator [Beijerinckiaceae bacterium]
MGFRPLYRQVRERLSRRIAEGEWRAGDMVPSEQQIAAEMGVSQGTVRKALDEMTADNLLVRRQGRGTFVATHDEDRILFQFFKLQPDDGTRSFPESEVVSAVRVTSNPQETAKLSLAPGDPVIRIRRVRSLLGRRCIVEDIALPAALFDGFDQGAVPNNLYDTYARRFGVTVAGGSESLKAVAADAEAAGALGLAVGAALLLIDRVAHSISGQPVEWRVSLCHTADIRYLTELR